MTSGPLVVLAALGAAGAGAALVPPRPAPLSVSPPDAPSAGPTDDPRSMRVLVTGAVGLGVAVLLGHLGGMLAGSVAAAVAWHLTGRMETPAARRRRERLAADLPHVVDLMAATLAAGLSPPTALARVAAALDGPVAEELDTLTARLALGADPASAWAELGRHPQLGPLGRCVARSVDSGSSVAEGMTRLAEDMRRDVRAQVEARARSVGVKAAVPLGVCMLPAFLLVGVVPLVVGAVPVVLGR